MLRGHYERLSAELGRGRRSVAPYRRVFGVCPACGGKVLPLDWTDVQQIRRDYRRCSRCRRLVMPAQEGFVVEEAPPRATRATRALMADALAALVKEEDDNAPDNLA